MCLFNVINCISGDIFLVLFFLKLKIFATTSLENHLPLPDQIKKNIVFLGNKIIKFALKDLGH